MSLPSLSFLLRITALAALMALGGTLGQMLAVPPGYASPIWPPAGLALAMLLLWGRNLWPGIWLGSFGLNLWIGSGATGDLGVTAILTAAGIACGSTLQALAAAWLSARYIRPGVPRLDTPRTIFTFLGLSGTLACLIAPTVGVSTLLLTGVMPQTAAVFSWWNWWVGDALGVVVITPLIFCLFAVPHEFWQPRRMSVALPLTVTLGVLITVFVFVLRAEQSRVQLQFDNLAAPAEKALAEHMENVIDGVTSVHDFYKASNEVNRNEFATFTRGMLKLHPELQALSWAPRVPGNTLHQFEQAVQSQGLAGFRVVERTADGALIPVQPRAEHFPISFIEPMRGNEKALGYDLYSDEARRNTMQAAGARSRVSATSRIHLVQDDNDQHGMLVVVPVYANAAIHEDSSLAGFITGIVRVNHLADIALQGLQTSHLHITLRDLSAPAALVDLYSQGSQPQRMQHNSLHGQQRQLMFGDRQWQITVSPDQDFVRLYGSWLPWITLSGGLLFTGMLSIYLLTISGRAALIQQLVEEKTGKLRESETKLRTIIESDPECVKLLARNGELLQMNRAGLDMIEADALEQVVNRQMVELVLPQYRKAFSKLARRVFNGGAGTLEFEIRGLKGGHRWLETHAVPMRDAQGNITALLGITRDITTRKQADDKLKLAARVFGEAHEGITITDASGIIVDVNPTFCEITGYSRDEAIGQKPSLLKSGRHPAEFYTAMWQELNEHGHWQGEVWNRHKSGELYAELLTISTLRDEAGNILHYVGLFSDITQSKQQQLALEMMAHYDVLTKLPNRALFSDRFHQAIARSRRENLLLAVCYLDLDGFKQVNDTLGHEVGDQLLIDVANRLRAILREEDTVSRLGGDEFAILMGDIATLDQCEQTLKRIHRTLAQPYLVGGQPITIAASSGVTIYPSDHGDPDTLLRHADQAMYQAKQQGRNRYHLFDAAQDLQAQSHRQQLNAIEAAFERSEFCLYYQPKVNMKTGEVVGTEALIRWQHPERGIIPPADFLPVIEGSPMEIIVGNWVIDQALTQIDHWKNAGLDIQISVNISPRHLQWKEFFSHLDAVLSQHPAVPSQQLQLEVLESSVLDDMAAIIDVVRACRDVLGVSIALDDFGTGYSSLTHLRHLPVDTVKIDQSFVRDIIDDPSDFAIVEGVIGLAAAFRREVVAEGVETREHGLMLLVMGCTLAQGYGIARPMPAQAFLQWKEDYRPDPKWIDFKRHAMSPTAAQSLLLYIGSNQWRRRLEECLQAGNDGIPQWPIMNHQKCHCGRWLAQARHEKLIDPEQIERIDQAHQEMHRIGSTLMHQFLEGHAEQARTGIQGLRTAQQAVETVLEELS